MAYYLDDTELYLFNEGSNAYAYRALGCHRVFRGRKGAMRFAVWAPCAKAVSVVGDFNDWDDTLHPMERVGTTGVWQLHVEGLEFGQTYKYSILTPGGERVLRADPFAFCAELRPGTASRTWDLKGYKWGDANWMRARARYQPYDKPVSIFEVHLGSWRGEKNYREIADELAQYVKDMGYTHVELMPICEHPFDGSWGYQVTGYFAATARYGTPQDFMYFVDRMHQSGIGVLLDWVPAHFPRDEQGLRLFDGTACYEHEGPLEGEQPQWGTMLFNYGRGEVKSFLMSSAMFWLDQYHIDGLRVDAVSCMLYRNYGKKDGEWVANKDGGAENYEAIDFVRRNSDLLFRDTKGVIFAAEEASAFPLVTHPTSEGGLGFNFKWNMGWMNDMLEYMALDPVYRKWHHNKLTFSMMYAFSENFILPLSHDEVVHGKKSLIEKMPGDYWQKFANLRLFFAYMFAHPGKKLMFMGDEIGQFIEWRYYEPIEYKLLEYDAHRKLQDFVRALNGLYRGHPALYEIENSWSGFEWASIDDEANSVIGFARYSKRNKGQDEMLLCAFNFTPAAIEDYRMGVPRPGIYTEIFNSDEERFGGSGVVNTVPAASSEIAWNGKACSICFRMPPLGGVVFRYMPFAGDGRAKPEEAGMAKAVKAVMLAESPGGSAAAARKRASGE